MDFIFMLTRGDKTIEDCLLLFDQIAPLRLRHVGFKDVGVPPEILKALTDAIHRSGATSYMEVVSESPEAAIRSTRIAAELGVQRLLGGTQVGAVKEILLGTDTQYYPFPGRPVGHPTKLGGTAADIERDCREFVNQGCAGADLLAYRATEADPLDLVRAARKGLGEAATS
jgi:hypothetical protein